MGAEEKEENRKGTRGHGKKGGKKVWKKGRKKRITNRHTGRYLISESTCSITLFRADTVLHLDWYNCSYSWVILLDPVSMLSALYVNQDTTLAY